MRTISRGLNALVERYLPSAFIFALILTLLTLLMGMTLGHQSFPKMTQYWYSGFWSFLAFGMQMVLILVTGYALAKAPVVNRALDRLAAIPGTQRSALALTMTVSAVMGFISWGLGFVGGTLVAIAIAKRLDAADFRLLIAGSYAAVIASQPISLTLTAPLLVNTPGHSLEDEIGLIPVTQTLFSPTMILCAILGFIGVVIAFMIMAPRPGEVVPFGAQGRTKGSDPTPTPTSSSPDDPKEEQTPSTTIAERFDHSRILAYLIACGGLTAIVLYFLENGFNLELNIINFAFLIVGIALHGSPTRYAECITDGIGAASGIVLQFPFYAGIIGMMGGAGLIQTIGGWFASIATEQTMPVLTYISAMLLNIFVPSAGGQWQLQGPVMLEATAGMDISAAMIVNAVSVGDMTTNLLQPFFVLPALGLSGLQLKDIWGFCMTAMFVLIVICGSIFAIAPLLGW